MTTTAPSRSAVAVAVAAGVAVTLVWIAFRAAGGPETFWPRWVYLGLVAVLAGLALLRRARATAPGRARWLAHHTAVFSILVPLDVMIWVLAGGGFFWPVFPLIGFSAALGIHAWVVSRTLPEREEQLHRRVTALVRTRRRAVEDQAAALRRVERDLHDGAQARLVSLAVGLGLAERLVHSDPDAAATLLAESRQSATTALEEIRTVMADLRPPLLTDRGLVGALEALALDISIPTTVVADVRDGDLRDAIESAVYFAVAECLANAVKHSDARSVRVHLGVHAATLVVTVTDDGLGGASMRAGTGLRGVVARLEPLDGTVELSSPRGGPTVVTLRVPVDDVDAVAT